MAEGSPLTLATRREPFARRLAETLAEWTGARVLGLTIAVVTLLAISRLLLPPVSFVLVFLAPTAFAGWYGGRLVGASVAVFGPALSWLLDTVRNVGPGQSWLGLWESGSEAGVLVGCALALARYRSRLAVEERHAATDPLTELPNRGAFIARLEDELARASRYGYAFTLVYVDLDGFKAVNDVEGHVVGDVVLQRVADAMRASTRQTDHLGRLGGDEFAAVLPHTTVGPARLVLEKVRSELGEAMARGGWPVTFSIGAVTFETPIEDGQEALHIADEAMYYVKHSSKDGIRHVVWDGDTALP